MKNTFISIKLSPIDIGFRYKNLVGIYIDYIFADA